MRRSAAIAAVLAFAAVAYGRPRPDEPPVLAANPSRTGSNALNSTTSSDDTIWYGGTTWMPDSLRWEAIRDSVWTFDAGVGSSINTGQNLNKPVGYHQTMEGWYGIDQTLPMYSYFRRSSTCAISGSYSMWAGVTQHEADSLCYAAGQGYGNDWWISLAKSFQYSGSGDVTLSFQYSIETEFQFGFTIVVIDTFGLDPWNLPQTENDLQVIEYTGVSSGIGTFHLVPGVTLRSTPGLVIIRFDVYSDAGYSDEDGMFASTCGHTAIDNVRLSGALSDFSDFELDDGGWKVRHLATAFGDRTTLSFVDSLPSPATSGPCALEDSVLTMFDARDNLAVSPWIDLKRAGDGARPGRLLSCDIFSAVTILGCNREFVSAMARWYPAECSTNGLQTTTDFVDLNFAYFNGQPYCSAPGAPWITDVTDIVGPQAEQIQIAFRTWTLPGCPFLSSSAPDHAWPRIDNVRFGVYGTPVGVPEVPEPHVSDLMPATPNPFRTSTSIAFTLEHRGPVNLTILDVAGRLVRTLIDVERDGGSHLVDWDGLNDAGHPVPDGLYFYRLTADERSMARKVMVLR